MQTSLSTARSALPRRRDRWTLGAVILAIAITYPAFADRDPKGPRFATEKISVAELNGFRIEVRSMPGVRCEELASNLTQCESKVKNTVWAFTREGHPAHPAVSRRVMVLMQTSSGNAVLVNRTGHYAGDTLAFRTWMKEFAAIDQKQVAAGKDTLEDQP